MHCCNQRVALAFLSIHLLFATQAQTIYWNFGTTVGDAAPVSSTSLFVFAGAISQGNNNGTTALLTEAVKSDNYVGASGQFNAGAAIQPGAMTTNLNGSTYFEFTLTPATNYTLSVTNISFGMRSTPTGPQAFCIRSSLDNYASNLATGAIVTNSVWSLKTNQLTATSEPSQPVTLRIYGYDGSGTSSTANWRIDDLTVAVNGSTTSINTPPIISPVLPKSVRIGQTLTLELTITPTDGDLVTYTNVTVVSGANGAFSLTSAVFNYTPADIDLGPQSFIFSVADKDGTNNMITTVNVLPQQVVAISMTTLTNTYIQDFNVLAMTGLNNKWDNAAFPLPAWYAYASGEPTHYLTGTGSITTCGIYSFGEINNVDRSLGTLAGNENANYYGVAFTNETGVSITNLVISFTAEQWRVANSNVNTLTFEYCITNRVIPFTAGVWSKVNELCFNSPIVLDENHLSACAVYASSNLTSNLTSDPILSGQVIILRWCDPDNTGSDHAFGIDDLTVIWHAEALPKAPPAGSVISLK